MSLVANFDQFRDKASQGLSGTTQRPLLLWLTVDASYSHNSLALPWIHSASGHALSSNSDLPDGPPWVRIRSTVDSCSALSLAVRAARLRPQIVAATVYLFNREFLMKVLRRLKALCPESVIILGGPEFLGDNRLFMERERTVVRAVCRGEGETALPAFIKLLKHPEQWSEVPGLCWIDAVGRYHDNGCAVTPGKILEDAVVLSDEFYDWERPFATIETSRGCFSQCAYCTSSAGGPVRNLSLKRVRGMLDLIREKGKREVRVLDRTFNIDKQRCQDLLACFADEFPEMRFHIEIHPAFLSPGIRRSLKCFPSGRLHIEAGWQTGLEAGLKAAERPGSAFRAWDGLRFLCETRNLEVHVDLLAGLPEVDFGQIMHDLRRLIVLGPAEIQLELLKLLPGTKFREYSGDYSITYAPDSPYEVLTTDWVESVEILKLRDISRFIDDFYNEPQLQTAVRRAVLIRGGEFLPELLEKLRPSSGEWHSASLTKRFRMFHELCQADSSLAGVGRILEYQWLKHGHSPDHGIKPCEVWKGPVPADACLIAGRDDLSGKRRIRQGHIGDFDYWFVFLGAVRQKGAAAVYRRPLS